MDGRERRAASLRGDRRCFAPTRDGQSISECVALTGRRNGRRGTTLAGDAIGPPAPSRRSTHRVGEMGSLGGAGDAPRRCRVPDEMECRVVPRCKSVGESLRAMIIENEMYYFRVYKFEMGHVSWTYKVQTS